MIPIAQIRRLVARARAGDPQQTSDLDVIDSWLRQTQGKREPKAEVNARRLAEVLWQQEVLGKLQRHAIDAAIALHPGCSYGTVRNHLNRAKPNSPRLISRANRFKHQRLDDDRFNSSEAQATRDEAIAEGISAAEDFKAR